MGPRKDLQYPYQEKKDGEEFVQTISDISSEVEYELESQEDKKRLKGRQHKC